MLECNPRARFSELGSRFFIGGELRHIE